MYFLIFSRECFEFNASPPKSSLSGQGSAGNGCRSTLPLLQHIAGVYPRNLYAAQCKQFALRESRKFLFEIVRLITKSFWESYFWNCKINFLRYRHLKFWNCILRDRHLQSRSSSRSFLSRTMI